MTLTSWDSFNPELLAQNDTFVLDQQERYHPINWGSGKLGLINANDKTIPDTSLRGLYIPYTTAPQQLTQILDKLIQQGIARKNRVKHSKDIIKEYITFKDNSYRLFPLITGVRKLADLVPNQCYRPFVYDREGNKTPGPYPDPTLNVGIATGKRTSIPKDFTPQSEIDTLNFVSILFVMDLLWDNGYTNDGIPIPLKMNLNFPAGDEFFRNVLVKHAQLVERARNLYPEYKYLQPWQLGIYMRHNDELYDRGVKKPMQVYEVVAQFPETPTKEYYQKMLAANVAGTYDKDRVKALAQLIYEPHTVNGQERFLPTGPAMKWAEETTRRNIEHQRKVNPVSDKFPYGPQAPGKAKAASEHLIRYMMSQQKDTDTNAGDVAFDASSPTDTSDPIIAKLLKFENEFRQVGRTDVLALIEDVSVKYAAGSLTQVQINAQLAEFEREKQSAMEQLALANMDLDQPF